MNYYLVWLVSSAKVAIFCLASLPLEFKGSGISDTLHRFWKKEHDWGWKKFMELSKLNDGFVVEDVLTIKAQVQVIRYLFHVGHTFNAMISQLQAGVSIYFA
jgi:hypothetical protein